MNELCVFYTFLSTCRIFLACSCVEALSCLHFLINVWEHNTIFQNMFHKICTNAKNIISLHQLS